METIKYNGMRSLSILFVILLVLPLPVLGQLTSSNSFCDGNTTLVTNNTISVGVGGSSPENIIILNTNHCPYGCETLNGAAAISGNIPGACVPEPTTRIAIIVFVLIIVFIMLLFLKSKN